MKNWITAIIRLIVWGVLMFLVYRDTGSVALIVVLFLVYLQSECHAYLRAVERKGLEMMLVKMGRRS